MNAAETLQAAVKRVKRIQDGESREAVYGHWADESFAKFCGDTALLSRAYLALARPDAAAVRDMPFHRPPDDLDKNLGLAQQCWHMANAACDALGMWFDSASPADIYGTIANRLAAAKEPFDAEAFVREVWTIAGDSLGNEQDEIARIERRIPELVARLRTVLKGVTKQ